MIRGIVLGLAIAMLMAMPAAAQTATPTSGTVGSAALRGGYPAGAAVPLATPTPATTGTTGGVTGTTATSTLPFVSGERVIERPVPPSNFSSMICTFSPEIPTGDDVAPDATDLDEDDPHVIFFTSGSTGRPKGVVLSHRTNWLRTYVGATSTVQRPVQ